MIAGSAVTWISAAAAAAPLVAGEIAKHAPDHAEEVARYGTTVAAWLISAVAIIRIVFPAPEETHGILLPEPTPEVAAVVEELDADFGSYAETHDLDTVVAAFLEWRARRSDP